MAQALAERAAKHIDGAGGAQLLHVVERRSRQRLIEQEPLQATPLVAHDHHATAVAPERFQVVGEASQAARV